MEKNSSSDFELKEKEPTVLFPLAAEIYRLGFVGWWWCCSASCQQKYPANNGGHWGLHVHKPYKHWAVLLLLRHWVTASLSKWHRRLFGWGKHALEPRVMSALAQLYENTTEISLYSTVSSIPHSCMFPSFMKPKGALMLKVNYISVTV